MIVQRRCGILVGDFLFLIYAFILIREKLGKYKV